MNYCIIFILEIFMNNMYLLGGIVILGGGIFGGGIFGGGILKFILGGGWEGMVFWYFL